MVLFTKWNRFSRNAGDAYQMISTLRRLGVEPQAVEQSLDLSIPENKRMLAFYLAAPEVENDRRALNVFHGMRRAKKKDDGWLLLQLDILIKLQNQAKSILPLPKKKEATGELIRWVFEELAQYRTSVENGESQRIKMQ